MIKLFVMDVDGTLTDGKIYMGANGEVMKAFNIKDGLAIKTLLPRHNITPIIITARCSDILRQRCAELGVTEFYQNTRDKLSCISILAKKHSCSLSEVAYVGDDLIDLQCMSQIKSEGGFIGCPADSASEIISISDYISPYKACDGAIRNIIEYIVMHCSQHPSNTIESRLNKVIEYLNNLEPSALQLGKHVVTPDFFYTVFEYKPNTETSQPFESHRRYIDIQRIVSGCEFLKITDISKLVPSSLYDETSDVQLYHSRSIHSGIILHKGSTVILFPSDAHKVIAYNNEELVVKKIVGKLLIDYEA